jgi:uncharacterized protein (TIGR02996 family)
MSDEGFLRAMLADPSDNAARLVYADWLEEHGDSTRAEALRLLAEPTLTAWGKGPHSARRKRRQQNEQSAGRRQRIQQLAAGLDTEWLAAVSGLTVAVVRASFRFAAGSRVSFADSLEVSLDCCVCRRCWRTVVFRPGPDEGTCTPTRHAFPGYWLGKEEAGEGAVASACYRVAYRYAPFVDAKYPQQRRPQGVPTWARVSFTVTCPFCGESGSHSAQNNTVRPWTCRCRCNAVLYHEEDEMPVLFWTQDKVG